MVDLKRKLMSVLHGIEARWALYKDINYNTVTNNAYGILLRYTSNSTVSWNYIKDSTNIGVYLWNETGGLSAANNIIHHNTFLYNNIQGYDTGNNNIWYDIVTSEGNYWSDWTSGTYTVGGTVVSVDFYPLAIPTVPEIPQFFLYPLVILINILVISNIRKIKKNREE